MVRTAAVLLIVHSFSAAAISADDKQTLQPEGRSTTEFVLALGSGLPNLVIPLKNVATKEQTEDGGDAVEFLSLIHI